MLKIFVIEYELNSFYSVAVPVMLDTRINQKAIILWLNSGKEYYRRHNVAAGLYKWRSTKHKAVWSSKLFFYAFLLLCSCLQKKIIVVKSPTSERRSIFVGLIYFPKCSYKIAAFFFHSFWIYWIMDIIKHPFISEHILQIILL